MPVERISGLQTRPLRKKILRPDLTMDQLNYNGDEDETSAHFGYIEDDAIKGIATLYNSNTDALDQSKNMYRLRGMAVEEDLRGKGIGSKLIASCVKFAKENGGDLIWCDARLEATEFYKSLGFKIQGDQYIVKNVGPHYLMYLDL